MLIKIAKYISAAFVIASLLLVAASMVHSEEPPKPKDMSDAKRLRIVSYFKSVVITNGQMQQAKAAFDQAKAANEKAQELLGKAVIEGAKEQGLPDGTQYMVQQDDSLTPILPDPNAKKDETKPVVTPPHTPKPAGQ